MSSLFSGFSFVRLILIVAISTKLAVFQNFKTTFGNSSAPFKIDVDPKSIEETVLKASLTRYVVDLEEPALQDGPSRDNVTTVQDYWVNQYN